MDEQSLIRKMPESLEAERSVIGCMLMDREAVRKATDILVKEDFQYQNMALLFECISELFNDGHEIDSVILQDKLRSKSAPPEIADEATLQDLVFAVPSSLRVAEYAGIVKDKAALRNTIRALNASENECYAAEDPVDVILERAEQAIFQLSQNRGASDFEPIEQIARRAFSSIDAAAQSDGNVTGIASGFDDLDFRTAGFQNSDLILVAARPSMGKTALVLNIALNIMQRSDKKIAIFSLEMPKEQLVKRLFSMESRVDSQKIRVGRLNWDEWEALAKAEAFIARSNLIIDDTPGISIQELRSKCRKYKVEHGIDIVMIDYLQLMQGSARADSRQQEISEISRSLKALARELDVPLIALSQLSRAVEGRPDKRPVLSDLRESGAIEQDADVVMFIYREDYYKKDTERKGISEIIIAKQRNGPIGTVELAWLPENTLFRNLDRREQSKTF